MPVVPLPNYLNPESLYLYCELSAINSKGDKIDFTGFKTYSIGFMKENLGFGITDINVEISPSMQPIIEITFKDFYGNLAFGFSENKKILENLVENDKVGELDFSSMFDLPYPKFKLAIKGYLGHPIILELNVKKINVSIVPTDGSYEIKALFVPNLYGFFADIPYYFLKAVKALRAGKNGIDPSYLSTWDIAILGEEIQKEIKTIDDSFSETNVIIDALLNPGRDKMFNIEWFNGPLLKGQAPNGTAVFDDLYLHIEPLAYGNSKLNLSDPVVGKTIINTLRKNTGVTNNVPNKEIYRRALIASLSKNKDDKKYQITTNPPAGDVTRGTELLKGIQKSLEKFRNTQLTTGKELKIKNVTIKRVFDLIIKDTAFLMGKILQAGQEGFRADKNRIYSKTQIGNYFPFIQDTTTNEQIPDPNAVENNFVGQFVKALTEGIVSDINKGIENNAQGLNTPSTINKRVNNVELLSPNPFNTNNVDSFITSFLLRSGLAMSMIDDSTGVSYEIGDGNWKKTNLDEIVKSEIENADIGIKQISSSNDKFSLLNFCKFITKILNDKGELKNDSGGIVDLSQPASSILDLKYTLPEDTKQNKLSQILNKYLPAHTGVNIGSYKAYQVIHNGVSYFSRIKNEEKVLYLLFKNDDNSSSATQFANANQESSYAFDSSRFEIIEVEDKDDDIHPGFWDKTFIDLIEDSQIIDYNKIKNNQSLTSQNLLSGNVDVYFTAEEDKLNEILKNSKHYVGLYTTGKNDAVWNLFGEEKIWVNQRKYLYQFCNSIKSKISEYEEEEVKKVNETIDKLETQYNVFYTQFHHICNNWQNLLSLNNLSSSNDIANELETLYSNNGYGQVIYQMPLQGIQDDNNIKIENAIINTKPLIDNNSQTTVLNIMGGLCHLNNFMFLSIPGNGANDSQMSEIFSPYDKPVRADSMIPNNFFYVIFMPTPENRVSYNNNDPLYQTFEPSLSKEVFEVIFGSPDNTIIKSINLTTEDNKVTAESAIAISNLVDGPNSRKAKNLDCSALSVMEGRSYKLNGEMIGNAQIVPTQFFVVRKIPIFNGLYQIMKVKHRITPNNMVTSFEAIKMKFSGNDSKQFVFVPPITLDEIGISSSNRSVVNNNNTVSVNTNFVQQFANDRYSYIKSKENGALLRKGKNEYTKPFKDAKSFSIGYGHYLINDIKNGFLKIDNIKIPMSEVNSKGITIAQCDKLFTQDVTKFENSVRNLIPDYDSLSENKKGALLSYIYNTGTLNGPGNSKQIINAVNAQDHILAADSIKNGINTVGGQLFQPLVVRRAEEAELYKIT